MKIPEIGKAAVLGGGLIGSSWAANFLWKGVSVNIYDISDEALETTRSRIRENLEYLVSKGVLTAGEMNVALGLAKYTMSFGEAVEDARFLPHLPVGRRSPRDSGSAQTRGEFRGALVGGHGGLEKMASGLV
jgi:carnitine 3-dehydrogenase